MADHAQDLGVHKEVEVHPARRWRALIGLAFRCAHDLTTVGAWAREAGICETQLRLRCRLAGVTAKASLDFVRILRATSLREARGGSLKDYLDVGDARTTDRLFARVGLNGSDTLPVWEYVHSQRAIKGVVLIEEVETMLAVLAPIATS